MGVCLPACLVRQKLPYAPKTLKTHSLSPKIFPNNAEMFPTKPQRTPKNPYRPNAPRTFPNVAKWLMCFRTFSDVPRRFRRTRRQSCTDNGIICALGIKNHARPSQKANQPSTHGYATEPSLHCAIASLHFELAKVIVLMEPPIVSLL